MSALNIHTGKRFLLEEMIIDVDDRRKVGCYLLEGIDECNSVIHMQRLVVTDSEEEYRAVKGGLVLDVELLSDLKEAIDALYLSAHSNGLL